MSSLALIEAVCRDTPNLILAAPILIGILLLGSGYMRRQYRQHDEAIEAEMRRLMTVYVTLGDWTPSDTAIGQRAEAALKARVIIKAGAGAAARRYGA